MITNRGMLKWQPFSAVVPSSYMVNEVLKEKNKIKMPVLSEDQIKELQDKMLLAYNSQDEVEIKYYREGRYYITRGKITNIDENKHKLAINGSFWVFFSQIIDFL